MAVINSRDEWSPLQEIVVGSALYANWPSDDPVFATESSRTTWRDSAVPSGPVPAWIVDQSNRELDMLCETLLRHGVQVQRPSAMDFVALGGMYNYCPRDRLLIAGATVVDCAMLYPCRDQETLALQHVINSADQIHMPRNSGMILDAANVCRLGDSWLFLESASGNRAAYEWLCDQFPDITIELCNFYSGVHIDSTIVPLRQGLVLLNASRVNESNCPRVFRDWQRIYITEDQIAAQDFYQYPYASKWIAMNMLAINPETVIVDKAQTQIIAVLKQHGIDSIPLTLSHSRTLGGGFHCVTLDIRRQHE